MNWYKEPVGESVAERKIDLMEHDTNGRWVSVLPLSTRQGMILSGYGDPINGSPIPPGTVVELPLKPDITWQEASGVIKPSDLHIPIDYHDSE